MAGLVAVAPDTSPGRRRSARRRAPATAPARGGRARRPAGAGGRHGRLRRPGWSPLGGVAVGSSSARRSCSWALSKTPDVLLDRPLVELLDGADHVVDPAGTRCAPARHGRLAARRRGRSSGSGHVVRLGGPRVMGRTLPPAARHGASVVRPGSPAVVEVRARPPRPRPATSRPPSPVAVDRRARPSLDPRRASRPAAPPSSDTVGRGVRLDRARQVGARRTSAAARARAATSSARPVTPGHHQQRVDAGVVRALDVGVEPVADHQRPVAAAPAARSRRAAAAPACRPPRARRR